jgi:hypothetical protein
MRGVILEKGSVLIRRPKRHLGIYLVDRSFLVILGQGRSGSTLIMRLLNAVPGICIAGENHFALDYLRTFSDCFEHMGREDFGQFWSLAWTPPTVLKLLDEKLRELVWNLYNPEDTYSICGFKEIRYGRKYDNLKANLAFLRRLFPTVKIIFNVRNIDDCVKSGWWAEDPEGSRAMLETIRDNFERYYAENSNFCYWMPYEELKRGSPIFRDMFHFLGIQFRPEYETPLDLVLR